MPPPVYQQQQQLAPPTSTKKMQMFGDDEDDDNESEFNFRATTNSKPLPVIGGQAKVQASYNNPIMTS